ncbi:hypothetical protein C8R44DRAFT_892951 [Mycena epipterygia]|nr:hypothetical protein C8R44DRAFT_892951 [Mycena epipterygia]
MLSSAFEATVNTTRILAMMTNTAIYHSHPGTISSAQSKKWPRGEHMIKRRIPNTKTLLLKGCNMMESRAKEAVHILWFPPNDTSRKDILFLVVNIWGVIKYNPNVYPAVRHLVSVQLIPINGKNEDHVICGNTAFCNSNKIITSIEEISVWRVGRTEAAGHSGSLILFGIQPAAIALETFGVQTRLGAWMVLPDAPDYARSADPGWGDGVAGGCQSDYGGGTGTLEFTAGLDAVVS